MTFIPDNKPMFKLRKPLPKLLVSLPAILIYCLKIDGQCGGSSFVRKGMRNIHYGAHKQSMDVY